mmetsp:Transcript_10142/g.30117  ORF Transcript_10142/g.30117 Transcript_10142/m.30117 type:complete len:165 (-) Transcript_10142:89-583(-)
MSNFRASGTFALPPKNYAQPKGAVYKGVGELERFEPTYPSHDEVFEEYMAGKSMTMSPHRATLKSSSGLYELHYDTMRKKAIERAGWPTHKTLPGNDRPYTSCAGYSGFIPGKISNNICGCSHKVGLQLAYETRGSAFPPPMSGLAFSLGAKSTLSRSQSMPQF